MNRTALGLAVLLLAPSAGARDSRGLPPREIDLLAKIDLRRDVVQGKWGLEKGVLVALQGPAEPCRIELPFAPGDGYDLRVVVERKEGNPPFIVGFPVGDRQITVDVDGWAQNDKCGISLIDGKPGDGNETSRLGKLLTNDQPSTILCAVRRGRIRVVIDGRPVIDWKGEGSRLSLWPGWKMPHPNTPFVATWGGLFRVTRIGL
ncbi:MAG TPA: hypothetical protein VEN81_05685, partial [Planctomycetota bacterium]|nr:hypothetical protein [Planctomycetota bacterium]